MAARNRRSGKHEKRQAKTVAARHRAARVVGASVVVALAVAGWFAFGGGWLSKRSDTVPGRWYSAAMVAEGADLFAEHCAVCHGATGQGAFNWRQRDTDGNFPPPPLNGSGHTWHHPLRALRATIVRGGASVGGTMPTFGAQLDRAQRDAVIAYIQSIWPDEIYRIWAKQVERIEAN